MMHTEVAKRLMREMEAEGKDNVFTANRIYGMAIVHWEMGNITIHELNKLQDMRDECNIEFIKNGF